MPATCIMNIGSMNYSRQQAAQHIHYNVLLPAFPFPSVKSVGYNFHFLSSVSLFYRRLILLRIRILKLAGF